MGAAAGHDGGEAGASPWSEADNDELGDGVPPELTLRLVRTGAIVGVLHIGNRRRRLGGGLQCVLRTQASAGGHESHRDGEGEGAALFPGGLLNAQLAAAPFQAGMCVLNCGSDCTEGSG
ncbi:uncharacterized protein [Miscanthus floridulus]|uniref:uncharacterized protein n=1 Tax=Miscanthus floridulus TaxID=154761 RepID=UPI003459B7D5